MWDDGGFFVALALAAIPAGEIAVQIGNRRAMLIGLAAMTGFSWLILFTHSVVIAGVGIALGASFSLVTNGAIPFALALSRQGGLGSGFTSVVEHWRRVCSVLF